jgi:outer membrane protein assembly factor BamB/predicted MPP superfamily phosphohydrolase
VAWWLSIKWRGKGQLKTEHLNTLTPFAPFVVEGRMVDSNTGRGISGVSVSNGEFISSSADDGSFRMEIRPEVDRHLFVTVPSGFRPGSDYYKSTGDIGLDSTPVRFMLEPFDASARECFTCAHITDLHVGLSGATQTPPETLRRDFSGLMRESLADLVIASGDLTQWGDPDQLSAVAETADVLPCPWFPLFGAHDGNSERLAGTSREEMDELRRLRKWDVIRSLVPETPNESWTRNFEAVFGPPWYSFDWGRWHFAMFPNEEMHSPVDEERKARWLWADLELHAENRAIAVIVHQPPPPDFLDRLEHAGVRLVLLGHWHSAKVFRWGGMTVAAAPPFCFGGLDTSPRGYHRIDFDGDSFQMERRVLVAGGTNTNRSAGPGPRWECRLPGQMHRAAPVRCGDHVLASTQNPVVPGSSGVACVDADSGAIRWFLETDNAVPNRVALDSSGIRGVAVSVTGEVCVFESASGTVCWKVRLPHYPYRWIHPAPLVVGDRVIGGGRAGYGCWDLQSGEESWYHELGSEDKWPSFSGPIAWGGLLILAAGDDGLEAIDIRTGTRVWHRPLVISHRYCSPVVVGDRVVHGGDRSDLYGRVGDPAGLVVLEAETGEVIWNRMVLESRYPSGMAATEESIFVSTPDGEVQAYEMETSQLRWRHATGESRLDAIPYRRDVASLHADPVVMGDELVIGGCDGVVVVLDVRTGAVRRTYTVGTAVTSPVCALDDGFCAGSFDGTLYRFDGSFE